MLLKIKEEVKKQFDIGFLEVAKYSKWVVNIVSVPKKDDIDKSDLAPKMLRLLTMKDKQILPHQEVTELINLGTNDEKKEVKIGSSLDASAKREITILLKEYTDIFAWSYQDMPGLSTEIVEYQLPMRPECRPV